MPANQYISIGRIAIARYKRLLFLLIAMLMGQSLAFAQNIQVSGTVNDSKGRPVEGASVIVKGATAGTSTDANGKFALSAARGSVLVFSFTGYETQEKKVQGSAVLNMVLRESEERPDGGGVRY
jgi:hypothetical protein